MAMIKINILISPRELKPKYFDEKIKIIKFITATKPFVTKLCTMFLNNYRSCKNYAKVN